MSVVARKATIQDMLSNRRHYTIAPYQRKYEWSRRHFAILLEDLQESFKRQHTSERNGGAHFIGSFIFQEDRNKLFVVDGQQRLTSLSIVLAAARDLTDNAALRSELQSFILDSSQIGRSAPTKRITHHRGDEVHFDQFVVSEGSTSFLPESDGGDEQRARLLQHIRRARAALAKLQADGQLSGFVEHVTQYCNAIEITISQDEDPFRIFTCVNGRGQPVRQQDVLRVTLVDAADSANAQSGRLLKKWDECERLLGAETFERYLTLRQTVATGQTPRHDTALTKPFPEHTDAASLRDFLGAGLRTECEAFDAVVKQDVRWRHNRKTYPLGHVLHSLGYVAFDDWKPIAVRILTKFERDPGPALAWLRKLESLSWYWFLDSGGKYDARDRPERYHSIDKYLRNHSDWDPARSNVMLTSVEQRSIVEFLRRPLDPDLPELRPLLLRLEQAMRKGEPATHLERDFTIEHIIPKSGGGREWMADLGLATDKEVRDLSLRLGNLCFVTRALNRELGEQRFPQKRDLAIDARASRHSMLAREFCTSRTWTPEIVENRTKRFADLLCSAWGVVV